jgi:hypothetical protein
MEFGYQRVFLPLDDHKPGNEQTRRDPPQRADAPSVSRSIKLSSLNEMSLTLVQQLLRMVMLYVVRAKNFTAGAFRAVPVLDLDSSNWSVDSAILTHIFPFPSCEP